MFPPLLAAAARIFRSPVVTHTKALVVDDTFVSIGSYNFDHRSLAYNLELVVNVIDPATAAEVGTMLISDMAASEELTAAALRASAAGSSACWSAWPTASAGGSERWRYFFLGRASWRAAGLARLRPAWGAGLAAAWPAGWAAALRRRAGAAPPASLRFQRPSTLPSGSAKRPDLAAARERQAAHQHAAAGLLDLVQRRLQIVDGQIGHRPRRLDQIGAHPAGAGRVRRRRASCSSPRRSAPSASRRPSRRTPRCGRSSRS